MKPKYSNCCGASPRCDEELEGGYCSECGEPCEYEEWVEEDAKQHRIAQHGLHGGYETNA